LLERLLAWVPLLLLAGAIIILAAAAGTWAGNLVRPLAEEQGVGWVSTLVRIGVIVFGILFALELMQIEFAEDIVKIVITGAVLVGAIAFGVGGIDAGRKWWAKYGSPESQRAPAPQQQQTAQQQQQSPTV
jgi:hypothetical protein